MSLTAELRQKFYRTGPLPEVHIPGAFEARLAAYYDAMGYKPDDEDIPPMEEYEERIRERLNLFADMIRQKERWYFKILEQENLAQKWMEEIDLVESEARALITFVVPLSFSSIFSMSSGTSRGRHDEYAHLIILFG
jgi:hypothetical protein